MTHVDNRVPSWLQTVQREAGLRRGLIVHGNVRDLFVDPAGGGLLALAELLSSVLGATDRFTVTGTWSHTTGLVFPSQEMRRRYQRASGLGAALEEAQPAGESYALSDLDPSTAGSDSGSPTPSTPQPLTEVLAEFDRVVAGGRVRPLLIVDWAHLLTSQAAHPERETLEWIARLGQTLGSGTASSMRSDDLRSPGGLVVLVTPQLGAIPPVLYQGDPRVAHVAVPRPTLEQRRSFLRRYRDELRVQGTAEGTPAPLEAAEAVAVLSDQLTHIDLRHLLALSKQSATPLRPEELINLYRYGEQTSPWSELSDDKLDRVDAELSSRVVGQAQAVKHAATMIIRAYLGLSGIQHSATASKPKGVLFFVGPTGVGKTELAKAIAAFLFGDESACIRFDMSEYNHEHSDQRLVGAPPGYVGFEEGGQLTNAVRERPFSVLLFDEIEKAHGRVLDKFLQVLEDGRLTDGRGDTAYFGESVIIFTSNIGAATLEGIDQTPTPEGRSARAHHFRGEVERFFTHELLRPELLNRLGDNIVPFDLIQAPDHRLRILDHKLGGLRTLLREQHECGLVIEPSAARWLIQQARAEHGGRGLVNAIERSLLNPLARDLFETRHRRRPGAQIVVSVGRQGLLFETRTAP